MYNRIIFNNIRMRIRLYFPYAPCMEYLIIFTYICMIIRTNVGQYSSTMEHMGLYKVILIHRNRIFPMRHFPSVELGPDMAWFPQATTCWHGQNPGWRENWCGLRCFSSQWLVDDDVGWGSMVKTAAKPWLNHREMVVLWDFVGFHGIYPPVMKHSYWTWP